MQRTSSSKSNSRTSRKVATTRSASRAAVSFTAPRALSIISSTASPSSISRRNTQASVSVSSSRSVSVISASKSTATTTQRRSFSSTGDKQYDVVVIGGGPGGYVAAIKAGQMGLKVACVEKRGSLGGTCLNVGCIPSKALLNATHHYETAKKHFKDFGIMGGENVTMDHDKLMASKEKVVVGLTKGIEGLFKKNKVDYIVGHGTISGTNEVSVTGKDNKKLNTKNILIATGSEPSVIPGVTVDEEVIVTSTGALSLKKVPQKMVVIGAGVIGLELGSVYSRLGTEVTVVGNMDRITPGVDEEVAKTFQRTLEKQGMIFKLGMNVGGVKRVGDGAEVVVTNKNGESATMQTDAVLLATGRRPYTDNLGLKELGIEMDRAQVKIDNHFRTNIKNIYAIGDVVAGPMLAHKAEEEGCAAIDIIAGKVGHVDYNSIPGVIYTYPEVASVGKTEEDLKADGIKYKVGKFPFMANSRARTNQTPDGFVKILKDATTDRMLGAHIIGPTAGELIGELTLGMAYGASAEDIAMTCHAHPTLSEAIKEAAMSKPIHF